MERTTAGRAIGLMHAATITADEADKAGDDRERVIACLATAHYWCEQALADLGSADATSTIARKFAPRIASASMP